MTTEIELTRVDEDAAQRLADATGKVWYLSRTDGYSRGALFPSRRMTTDRDEAVGWGEFVAVAPEPRREHAHVSEVGSWPVEPEPQLRVVRVLEYRGPKSWVEITLANSWMSPTEPKSGKAQSGSWEIVEQIRTTERLCRWCGGEHLGVCSEDGCSGNPRRGRY